MIALGIDTSNYTTSVAWFDGQTGENAGLLLTVKSGELGLRQSDALFQHVVRLPELTGQLAKSLPEAPGAVGASERPRPVEGSYMPCFLAGCGTGKSMASAWDVPYHGFSHQEGHLAAVLWSGGHMELMDQRFLAWHLSGGTTELLLVEPGLRPTVIGGTEDLSAGQLIDRTGLALGLDFPAGKALDALAAEGEAKPYPIKLRELKFSLSGMQNKAQAMAKTSRENTARFVLECLLYAIEQTTKRAREIYGDLPAVFTGGVSSNSLLRARMIPQGGIFGTPQCSTDNAMGIAVLTWLREKEHDQ